MKADKLISKSFEKLLERGKARGFITHEELKKSLGKRNSNPESLEKAVLNIFDNLITLVKQKSDFKVITKEEAPKAEPVKRKSRGFQDLVGRVKDGFDGLFEDIERK